MIRVLVTTDRRAAGPDRSTPSRERPGRPEVVLGAAVVERLRAQGLVPLLAPPLDEPPDDALVKALLDGFSAVVITGGAFDIHPSWYGQAVAARLDRVDAGRTGLELGLAARCLRDGLPILGICGGMQALAVAAGGTLVQDISTALPHALPHEQGTDPARPAHPVHLAPGRLRAAFGAAEVAVNSTHHQAVDDPGPFGVSGRCTDGVIEAIEHPTHPFAVGVQWHPELLHDAPFAALAAAAARR